MSSDRNSPPTSGALNGERRRGSMSGQFVDLFNARSSISGSNDERRASMFPGSIASAAAQAQQRRRLSLSTVGLSGSPNQASPFSAGGRPRADSISSVSNSASLDESPFEEGDAPPSAIPQSATFGRRLLRHPGSAISASAEYRTYLPISRLRTRTRSGGSTTSFARRSAFSRMKPATGSKRRCRSKISAGFSRVRALPGECSRNANW